MRVPREIELAEHCDGCGHHAEDTFCRLPGAELKALQQISCTITSPSGTTLFNEGEACRGIYILCQGRVKLSSTSSQGETLIFKIARPGDVLGLNASVSGTPYDKTAEVGQTCQFRFVRQAEFARFLKEHGDACMNAAIHLSRECQQAFQQFRSFAMRSASERIASLMLDWSDGSTAMAARDGIQVALTHEEIGQIIAMSRETVTRTLADLRKQHIAELHRSTLLIRNVAALQQLASWATVA